MALTRDFRSTVLERAQRDRGFREGLLRDAIESFLAGEQDLGKELLRDYIHATLGFPALAQKTNIHVKSLHQMLSPRGNPTANKLFKIIDCLQLAECVRFEVRTMRGRRRVRRQDSSHRTSSRALS